MAVKKVHELFGSVLYRWLHRIYVLSIAAAEYKHLITSCLSFTFGNPVPCPTGVWCYELILQLHVC
jgi:hypothetical protein